MVRAVEVEMVRTDVRFTARIGSCGDVRRAGASPAGCFGLVPELMQRPK